jgi:hypothetical protein
LSHPTPFPKHIARTAGVTADFPPVQQQRQQPDSSTPSASASGKLLNNTAGDKNQRGMEEDEDSSSAIPISSSGGLPPRIPGTSSSTGTGEAAQFQSRRAIPVNSAVSSSFYSSRKDSRQPIKPTINDGVDDGLNQLVHATLDRSVELPIVYNGLSVREAGDLGTQVFCVFVGNCCCFWNIYKQRQKFSC